MSAVQLVDQNDGKLTSKSGRVFLFTLSTKHIAESNCHCAIEPDLNYNEISVSLWEHRHAWMYKKTTGSVFDLPKTPNVKSSTGCDTGDTKELTGRI